MPAPDPRTVRAFVGPRELEAWLAEHHERERELHLRIYKKGSGVRTVTYDEAVDSALCWGWIDGLKRGYDDESFLQRFTPRKPKSLWSDINRGRVARLIATGRMTPHGQRHVDAAKADGRWEAAYGGQATLKAPPELLAAIAQSPRAQRTYDSLDKANLYALAWRVHTLKTAAGRTRKVEEFVALLERGLAVHPIKPKR